jgi:nucleotide-binding universal stress UspA family protein
MPSQDISPGRAAGQSGLRTVVVATDFSRDADAALRRASFLPFQPRGRLILAHVLPPRINRTADAVVRAAARRRLDDGRSRLLKRLATRRRTDVRVAIQLTRGSPAEEIGRLARDIGADLTVLGRRGHRTLRERLLGSVSERVTRHARNPVLVVARTPKGPYRSVLAGFDLSPCAASAIRLAQRVAAPGAAFRVAHVYENPYLTSPVPTGVRLRIVTEDEISRALPSPAAGQGPWQVVMRPGDPRRVILTMAGRGSCDLIALGSMGRTGLVRRLIGSVAEGVLHLAPVDVLIVPQA